MTRTFIPFGSWAGGLDGNAVGPLAALTLDWGSAVATGSDVEGGDADASAVTIGVGLVGFSGSVVRASPAQADRKIEQLSAAKRLVPERIEVEFEGLRIGREGYRGQAGKPKKFVARWLSRTGTYARRRASHAMKSIRATST